VLYLYALSEHPTVVPPTRGIEETPLAVERLNGIEAVVGVVDGDRIEPTEGAILAHARVVDDLAAVNAAVLPARFGRGYADAEALRQAVAERQDVLREALERVRGCVELGLRVLAEPESGPGGGDSGREYMLGRLEERRRAEQLAEELHAPLSALARAETRSVGVTPQLVLSAFYLVPRETVDEFRAALSELEQAHPAVTLACTGPWAPYSFATAEVGPA
jgi:Gas vesicle synthesis protein GvpL/GvpF